MKRLTIIILLLLTGLSAIFAAEDYKQSPEYLALRDTMYHAFNDGDSARFFPAIYSLQEYLLKQDDMHNYYTQRCNEIVFLLNQQRIFEAYKLALKMTRELSEKKLDKEMYMAYNMLGHLNRYCGNRETAKENFRQVIRMMEEAGYYESMPPIYMNIVNVSISDDPEEALAMLEKAAEIARQYAPQRVFDIETRRSLAYFNSGDMDRFVEGYKKYRQGVAEGKSSVHGRSMDIYYQAYLGHTDKAVEMARNDLSEEGHETITMIYERAGRWHEAYESLRRQMESADSINNVILSNSMQGYRNQVTEYEIEHEAAKSRIITLTIIILLLTMLIGALTYIQLTRRRHLKQLQKAYERALESDRLKSSFISNMSHEVRTPLNIIAGFAQVLADPDLSPDVEKRKEMARLIQRNNYTITNLIDEMLELALNENTNEVSKNDSVAVNDMLSNSIQMFSQYTPAAVTIDLDTSLADDFTITTNRDMLRRVVNALIDNAVKYTTRGSISLKASATDKVLTLVVEDTGCGIPAAEAERIFERFVKLNNFKEGIGLGLPLCRLIVTQLGGNIRLDTNYTIGARFIVTLNL